MHRDGYRDDPDEADALGEPFTERDWVLYGWADAWRLMVHQIENELDLTPEAARFRASNGSFSSSTEPTYVEPEYHPEVVAAQIGGAFKSKPIRRPK
jgi:hypothetical protein